VVTVATLTGRFDFFSMEFPVISKHAAFELGASVGHTDGRTDGHHLRLMPLLWWRMADIINLTDGWSSAPYVLGHCPADDEKLNRDLAYKGQ